MNETKITKEFVVEYAHRLLHHKGACNFLHGHSGRVIVAIKGSVDFETGMIIDFSDLKEACADIVGQYDHALVLNAADPLVPILDLVNKEICMNLITRPGEPTAENFSRWIAEDLLAENFDVESVTFYETAKNSATFTVGA